MAAVYAARKQLAMLAGLVRHVVVHFPSGHWRANSSARSRTGSLTVASARMRSRSSSFEIGGAG